jgi:hypothetical protein
LGPGEAALKPDWTSAAARFVEEVLSWKIVREETAPNLAPGRVTADSRALQRPARLSDKDFMKPTWDEWPEARKRRLPLFDVVLTILTPILALLVPPYPLSVFNLPGIHMFTIGPLGLAILVAVLYFDQRGAFDRRA